MKWMRPIITLIFAAGITAGFFTHLVPPEVYVPLAAVAVTWWYRSRDADKVNNK